MIKRCTKCGEVKPVSEFHKNSGSKDGLRFDCKACEKAKNKAWYTANKEKANARSRSWREANRDKVNGRGKAWHKLKTQTDPKFKINGNIRKAIWAALKGAKGEKHWEDLVGYTVEKLMKHLEKRFQPGMTWENYGTAWHIDHVVPVSAFNFLSPDHIDFKRCWALKNLRPLWAKENMSKGDKLDRHFQPSLLISI